MTTTYSIALSSDDSVLELIRDDGTSLKIRAGGHWVAAHEGDPSVYDRDLLDVQEASISVFDALEGRRKPMNATHFEGFLI